MASCWSNSSAASRRALARGFQLVGLPSVLRLHLPAFGLPPLHRRLTLGELGAPLPGRTTMITPANPQITLV